MTELVFQKKYGSLLPADRQTGEFIENLRDGTGIHGDFKRKRNLQFHKKYFALLNFAFEHWEPEQKKYKGIEVEPDFERFREDLTILSGHYKATFDINGEIKLKAKSISFARMDENQFSAFYDKTITVILRKVLINYNRGQLDDVVNELMQFV